jgi:3-deoxy-manno-octulosonate cytidylyltransferase (CMP-KDO synthetase)
MHEVQGVPMVERVWAHCVSTGFPTIIATDDHRLAEYMKIRDADVVITGDCETGSDRCAEAVERLAVAADIVVNCQCDMPFVPPGYIVKAIDVLEQNPQALWSTLWAPVPIVVIIPSPHGVSFFRLKNNVHVGIYAFRRDALLKFAKLPRSEKELSRNLEQMRLIDNGFRGAFAQVPYLPLEVNTPVDLEIANSCR